MSNETKNEPKSLAEMSSDELLFCHEKVLHELAQVRQDLLLARHSEHIAHETNKVFNEEKKSAERKLQEQAEAVRELLRYCSHLISCSYSEDFPCNCGFDSVVKRLKALRPTPEGGTK